MHCLFFYRLEFLIIVGLTSTLMVYVFNVCGESVVRVDVVQLSCHVMMSCHGIACGEIDVCRPEAMGTHVGVFKTHHLMLKRCVFSVIESIQHRRMCYTINSYQYIVVIFHEECCGRIGSESSKLLSSFN